MIREPVRNAPEEPEHRVRRLRMRSWRRGTREMDMILGPFADERLATMSGDDLALYEALLCENDQDLYIWVSGQQTAPARFSVMLNEVRIFHGV